MKVNKLTTAGERKVARTLVLHACTGYAPIDFGACLGRIYHVAVSGDSVSRQRLRQLRIDFSSFLEFD